MDKKSVIAIIELTMNYGVAALMEALEQLQHLENFTVEELEQRIKNT